MPPLEGNEEIREGKGLKTLTLQKLLTRLLILLAQIKHGNNSYKLIPKSYKYYIYFIHNKITKIVYNNLFKSL